MEISGEADFSRLLKLEEEYVQKMCDEIIAVKPDLVFTEKGVSGMLDTFSQYVLMINGCRDRLGSTFPHEAQHHCYPKA